MLLGGGMDSLAKGVVGKDIELRKSLLKQLRAFIALPFHEESNRGAEAAPLSVHVRRSLAFLGAAAAQGVGCAGLAALTQPLESFDPGTVELGLSSLRSVLASVLSLPVGSGTRVAVVTALAQSAGNTATSGSIINSAVPDCPLPHLQKFITQAAATLTSSANGSFTGIAYSRSGSPASSAPSSPSKGADALPGIKPSSSPPAHPPGLGRKASTRGPIPLAPDAPLPAVPTVIGTVEAIRILHLLACEALAPTRSGNCRPTFDETVVGAGLATAAAVSGGIGAGASSTAAAGSSPRPTSFGASAAAATTRPRKPAESTPALASLPPSPLRRALVSMVPALLQPLIELAQVKSVELETEPNAKPSTAAIRAAAALVLSDFTWLLCHSNTASDGGSKASPVEVAARAALVAAGHTLMAVLSSAFDDAAAKIQGSIIRFAMEQTGAVTANGEVPQQQPAAIAPAAAVPAPAASQPAKQAAPTSAGKPPPATAGSAGKPGAAATATAAAAAPAPPAPEAPPTSSVAAAAGDASSSPEYGLAPGMYESTCAAMVASMPAGEEAACWSVLNGSEHASAPAGASTARVRLEGGAGAAGSGAASSSSSPAFSFSEASLESGYYAAAQAVSSIVRLGTVLPYRPDVDGPSAPLASLTDGDGQRSPVPSQFDAGLPTRPSSAMVIPRDKQVPMWRSIFSNATALLSVPESSHRCDLTRLLCLLIARAAIMSEPLRVTACACGVLPPLAARMRDTGTDQRTRDICEGTLHVLVVLPLAPAAPSDTASLGIKFHAMTASGAADGGASSHVRRGSGFPADGKEGADADAGHDNDEGGGFAVLHGDPSHPACVPLSRQRNQVDEDTAAYLSACFGPEKPTSFAARAIDTRVFFGDGGAGAGTNDALLDGPVLTSPAGSGADLKSPGGTGAAADLKSPAKPGAAAAAGKDSKASSSTAASAGGKGAGKQSGDASSDGDAPAAGSRFNNVPEMVLPPGTTRAATASSASSSSGPYYNPTGPWLGTIDVAMLLCAGYSRTPVTASSAAVAGGQPGSASAAAAAAGDGKSASRPPSRGTTVPGVTSDTNAALSTASAAGAGAAAGSATSLPPVTPPFTVFDHTCVDIPGQPAPSSWQVCNLRHLEEVQPVAPWSVVPIGSGSLHVDDDATGVHGDVKSEAGATATAASVGAASKAGGKSSAGATATTAAAKGATSVAAPASTAGKTTATAPGKAGSGKGDASAAAAASVAAGASEAGRSGLAGADGGSGGRPSMASIVKFFALLQPPSASSTVSDLSWTPVLEPAFALSVRLRGLRLATLMVAAAQSHPGIRDLLIAARLPACVARVLVDAVVGAFKVPAAVNALSGTAAVSTAGDASAAGGADGFPGPISAFVGFASSPRAAAAVPDATGGSQPTVDTLLQCCVLALQFLDAVVKLKGAAGADVATSLAEIGPMLPDSILAVALHSDILTSHLPAIKEAVGGSGNGLAGGTSTLVTPTALHYISPRGALPSQLSPQHAAVQRSEGFIIPVTLADPRSHLLVCAASLPQLETCELRAWALQVLTSFAAADAAHRVYDWSTPAYPLPSRSTAAASSTTGAAPAAGSDTGKGKAAGASAAPAAGAKAAAPADAGKKGGKGAAAASADALAPAAAPVIVSPGQVFKSPIHPVQGPPVLGVDWEAKSESAGERLALSVLRYVPLLTSALSHPAANGGGVSSAPLSTPSIAASTSAAAAASTRVAGSAIHVGILTLIDAALTIRRARDRLAAEVLALLREYAAVGSALREANARASALNVSIDSVSSTGTNATATSLGAGAAALSEAVLAAAQRIFSAPRSSNGAPLLYGRFAALALGSSASFNALLHPGAPGSQRSAAAGPGSDGLASPAPEPGSKGAAGKATAPKAGGAADKKGAKTADASSSSAAGEGGAPSVASILAARRSWRHPIEGWGQLPVPLPSQVEDVIDLSGAAGGVDAAVAALDASGAASSSASGRPLPVFHDLDRFCVDGRPYYPSVDAADADAAAAAGEAEAAAAAAAAASAADKGSKGGKPASAAATKQGAAAAAGKAGSKGTAASVAGDTSSVRGDDAASMSGGGGGKGKAPLPDFFSLPACVWPLPPDAMQALTTAFGSPDVDAVAADDALAADTASSPLAASLSAHGPAVVAIARLAIDAVTRAAAHAPSLVPFATADKGAVSDAARCVTTAFVLNGLLQPLSALISYADPLPSDVEILLALRLIKGMTADRHFGASTQSAAAEIASSEAIRCGVALHTIGLADLPPVPCDAADFPSSNSSACFVHGVRGSGGFVAQPSAAASSSTPMSPTASSSVAGSGVAAARSSRIAAASSTNAPGTERLLLWKGSLALGPLGRSLLKAVAYALLRWVSDRPETRAAHWGRVCRRRPRPMTPEEIAAVPSLGDHPDWSTLPEGVVSVDTQGQTVVEEVYTGRDDPVYPSCLKGIAAAVSHLPPDAPLPTGALTMCLPVITRASMTRRRTHLHSINGPLLDLPFATARYGGVNVSPLPASIIAGFSEENVSSLVRNGASVDVRRVDGESLVTPLMTALVAGRLDVASALIDCGADVNAVDAKGNTVLKYAFLASFDADKRAVNELESDRSAVAVSLPTSSIYGVATGGPATRATGASAAQSSAIGRELLGASFGIMQRMARRMILRRRLENARKTLRDEHNIKTHIPVIHADWNTVLEAVRLLVERGIDVAANDHSGNGVLHWLVCGAFMMEPSVRSKSCRYVPIFTAPEVVSDEHRKLVDMLLHHGARLDLQNIRGATPLHCALECGKIEFAAHLVRIGADTSIADKIGCLPMHYAAMGRGFRDQHLGFPSAHGHHTAAGGSNKAAPKGNQETDYSAMYSTATAAAGVGAADGDDDGGLAKAKLVSPRAEFFLSMVLRALTHNRQKNKHAAAAAKRRQQESASSAFSRAVMQATIQQRDDELNASEPEPVLHPLKPVDILLHRNRYGITPLHVACGAGIDGAVPISMKNTVGAAAAAAATSPTSAAAALASSPFCMPTTYTGVHPMLLTLARHGSSVRAAGINVRSVNIAQNAGGDDGTGEATFMMTVVNKSMIPQFYFNCADEANARADIAYTILGLPDVLSSASSVVVNEIKGMRCDAQLAGLLNVCISLYESRKGAVASTKVVSRDSVQESTDAALDAAHAHAIALVSSQCKAGRNPLHYCILSWHSPLQELLQAGGRFLGAAAAATNSGTVVSPMTSSASMRARRANKLDGSTNFIQSPSTSSHTTDGAAAALSSHYHACWRILRYLHAAGSGTLPTPAIREPTTIESWRRSNPRGVRTLAYIPSTEYEATASAGSLGIGFDGVASPRTPYARRASIEALDKAVQARLQGGGSSNKSGVGDGSGAGIGSDCVPYPGVAFVQRIAPIADPRLLLSADYGVARVSTRARLLSRQATSRPGTTNALPSQQQIRRPQRAGDSPTAQLAAGVGTGHTPLGYALGHVKAVGQYATALGGLDGAWLGIAIQPATSPSAAAAAAGDKDSDKLSISSPTAASAVNGLSASVIAGIFVPGGLGCAGVVESPAWALAALGLTKTVTPATGDGAGAQASKPAATVGDVSASVSISEEASQLDHDTTSGGASSYQQRRSTTAASESKDRDDATGDGDAGPLQRNPAARSMLSKQPSTRQKPAAPQLSSPPAVTITSATKGLEQMPEVSQALRQALLA